MSGLLILLNFIILTFLGAILWLLDKKYRNEILDLRQAVIILRENTRRHFDVIKRNGEYQFPALLSHKAICVESIEPSEYDRVLEIFSEERKETWEQIIIDSENTTTIKINNIGMVEHLWVISHYADSLPRLIIPVGNTYSKFIWNGKQHYVRTRHSRGRCMSLFITK